jgi:hypothetical protein
VAAVGHVATDVRPGNAVERTVLAGSDGAVFGVDGTDVGGE